MSKVFMTLVVLFILMLLITLSGCARIPVGALLICATNPAQCN